MGSMSKEHTEDESTNDYTIMNDERTVKMDRESKKLDLAKLRKLKEAAKKPEGGQQSLSKENLDGISGGAILMTATSDQMCPFCGEPMTYVESYDEDRWHPDMRIDKDYVCLWCDYWVSAN